MSPAFSLRVSLRIESAFRSARAVVTNVTPWGSVSSPSVGGSISRRSVASWIADYPDGDNFMQLLYGANNHHIIEGIYKGFARAMREAVELDPRKGGAIPSTKGVLGG